MYVFCFVCFLTLPAFCVSAFAIVVLPCCNLFFLKFVLKLVFWEYNSDNRKPPLAQMRTGKTRANRDSDLIYTFSI